MSKINVLIVEDDPLYSVELERLVEEMDYELAALVDNSEKALQILEEQSVDVVLMDISIRGKLSGIELASQLNTQDVAIIFLTIFEDESTYLAAKNAGAAAYLVKPVKRPELQSAIESALLRVSAPPGMAVMRQWTEDLILQENFFIRNGQRLIRLNVRDIEAIEADGNYSIIHLGGKRYAVKLSLKKVRQRLSNRLFIQIHRNFIVQIAHIENIDLHADEIVLNEKIYPIGGHFKSQLIQRLNCW